MKTEDFVIGGILLFAVALLLICFGISDMVTGEKGCSQKGGQLIQLDGKQYCAKVQLL